MLTAPRLVLHTARPLLATRHLARMMQDEASPTKRPRTRPDQLLGEEMKRYEAETCSAPAVDVSRPVVVRLDGHCFHTYTKGFARPYDERIMRSMVGTATDLLERFGATTAYTESDEISLIFTPHTDEVPSPLPFNGRVQKIVSVFAGYASARFNAHMLREPFDAAREGSLRQRVERSEAHFDARVFSLPSLERLCAYMRWRAVLDCRRNSISMLAQAHFPPAELHGVDAATCLSMLSERKGVRWDETPPFFRYGTYVKKEVFWKDAFNPKTQQPVRARRTRAAARSFELTDDLAAAFLLEPLWPGEGPGPGGPAVQLPADGDGAARLA
jgi:tRNA(His) guanylyltransferase